MVTDSSGTDAKNSKLSAWIILFAPENSSLMGQLVVTLSTALHDLTVATAGALPLTTWLLLLCLTAVLFRITCIGTGSLPLPSTTPTLTASTASAAALAATAGLLIWSTKFFLLLCRSARAAR